MSDISGNKIMLQNQATFRDVLREKDRIIESLRTRIAELMDGEPIFTNGDRTMSMNDRNFTHERNGFIQDNNFDFDAGLQVSGDFVDDQKEQYATMIARALNSFSTIAPSIEGYVLVPIEPTDAMAKAGFKAWNACDIDKNSESFTDWKDAYKAMIEASKP